jgi:hypothetical protein
LKDEREELVEMLLQTGYNWARFPNKQSMVLKFIKFLMVSQKIRQTFP